MRKRLLFIVLLSIFALFPFVNIKADATYTVYVRRVSGGVNTPYQVAPMDTILSLKNQIETATNIPAERQTLIFAGTTLLDERTFADYNIQLDATIHFRPSWELTFDKKIAGDTTDISTELVTDGSSFSPQDITRDGYYFAGWFEENSDTSFDFDNTSIQKDYSFNAKWLEIINEIKATLKAPTVGDTVTLDTNTEPDKTPSVTLSDSKLTVLNTIWVNGTCNNSNACDEKFSGTFNEDDYYYADIELEVTDEDAYALVDATLNNLKVNGETPEEILPLTGTSKVRLIAKIKATTASEEESTTPETNNPQTGDDIFDYIVFVGLGIVGLSVTGLFAKGSFTQ